MKVIVFPVGSMIKLMAALAGRARKNDAVRQSEMFFMRIWIVMGSFSNKHGRTFRS